MRTYHCPCSYTCRCRYREGDHISACVGKESRVCTYVHERMYMNMKEIITARLESAYGCRYDNVTPLAMHRAGGSGRR
jgi:hypothetical protein